MRIEKKIAAIKKNNHRDSPRNDKAQSTNSPKNKEDYITQLSEETEGRVTIKLSQEFIRTKKCILGASSRLNEFPLIPQARVHSGPAPETFRNSNRESQ